MIRLSVDMMRILDLMSDGRTRSAAEVGTALGMDVRITSGMIRSAVLRGYLVKDGIRRTRNSCVTLYRAKRRM